MKHRLLLLSLLLVVLLAGGVLAQSFSNATVTNVDARGSLAQVIRGDGWYAWSVPIADDVSICCWGDSGGGKGNCCNGCDLDGNRGWSINNHDKDDIHQGGGMMIVAVKMEDGAVAKVRMLNASCPVNGRGNNVHVLQNVDPAASIAWLESQARSAKEHGNSVVGALATHEHPNAIPALERLAGRDNPTKIREDALFWLGNRGGERGFRFLRDLLHSGESYSLRKKAVFAVSQSDAEGAIPELINLARHDESREIRRESIFWLGQKAGSKAAAELRRFVDEDPDEDVREHAVFAISQLPRERSVPMLIDLVKNHKSPAVRKKAMFWLAQTGDDRAVELIEEILLK